MQESADIAQEATQQTGSGVWKPWPTLGLGLGIGLSATTVQSIVAGLFTVARMLSNPRQDPFTLADSIVKNGLVLCTTSILSELVVIGLVLLVIRLRRGDTISEYLALRPVSLRVLLTALIVMGAFVGLGDGITYLCGRPIVPQVEIEVFRTIVYPLLGWILLLVTAPIAEEVFFRGFVLEGFRRSRMGNAGAVVVTSLAWALLHLQYDLYNIALIIIAGLLLGAVRIKSRSLWPCIAMHSFMNLIATIELVFHLRAIG